MEPIPSQYGHFVSSPTHSKNCISRKRNASDKKIEQNLTLTEGMMHAFVQQEAGYGGYLRFNVRLTCSITFCRKKKQNQDSESMNETLLLTSQYTVLKNI